MAYEDGKCGFYTFRAKGAHINYKKKKRGFVFFLLILVRQRGRMERSKKKVYYQKSPEDFS